MPTLLKDDAGIPIPQYSNNIDSGFEPMRGENGAIYAYVAQLNDVLTAITDFSKATGNATILQQILAALQQISASLSSIELDVAAIRQHLDEETSGGEP